MIRQEVEAAVRRICCRIEVEILLLEACSNYVYMQISIPPWRSALEIIELLKSASSAELVRRYPSLSRVLDDQFFWADGYLLDTQNPSKRMILDYIDNQLQADWAKENG